MWQPKCSHFSLCATLRMRHKAWMQPPLKQLLHHLMATCSVFIYFCSLLWFCSVIKPLLSLQLSLVGHMSRYGVAKLPRNEKLISLQKKNMLATCLVPQAIPKLYWVNRSFAFCVCCVCVFFAFSFSQFLLFFLHQLCAVRVMFMDVSPSYLWSLLLLLLHHLHMCNCSSWQSGQ